MTKQEAEKEVVRRFHLLPLNDRRNYELADVHAEQLATEISFESVLGHRRLIAAWLIREVGRTRETQEAAAA